MRRLRHRSTDIQVPDNHLVYIFLSNRIFPEVWNNKLSRLDIRTRIQQAVYKALK